jgi:hypothetical protein
VREGVDGRPAEALIGRSLEGVVGWLLQALEGRALEAVEGRLLQGVDMLEADVLKLTTVGLEFCTRHSKVSIKLSCMACWIDFGKREKLPPVEWYTSHADVATALKVSCMLCRGQPNAAPFKSTPKLQVFGLYIGVVSVAFVTERSSTLPDDTK